MIKKEEVPVFVLCGGMGTRIKEETEFRPKPMVPIGGKPILWHILRTYRSFGFRRFILCLGFKAEVVKEYFLNYTPLQSDFTIDLKEGKPQFHDQHHDDDWEVTLAYTGETTMTGARILKAAKKYLGNAEHFAVTYGDGLTDANLNAEWEFHLQQPEMGTMLAIHPPSRFGELHLDGHRATHFEEKPEFKEKWINGGYFFFQREMLNYLSEEEGCILEKAALTPLARDGELNAFRHDGFWACMDTQRDRDALEALWKEGKAPWIPKVEMLT